MIDMFSSLFGMPIDAITEEDLIEYFKTDRQESNTIEYKSYDKRDNAKEPEKIGKIIRSVAAMLNSGGGIVIWGAPQPTKDPTTGEHIVKGNLAPVEFSIGKDRFMGLIFSNVSPAPHGIRFEAVQLKGNKFVYLIEVQRSEYPPHQYDGRYYARFDSLSKPAPHHFVEALIKQVKQPAIQGYVEFGGSRQGGSHVVIPGMMYLFNLDRHIPAANLFYEIRVAGAGLFLEDNMEIADLTNPRASLKIDDPRRLLNNMPVYRKFLIYAPLIYRRHIQNFTVDLTFWADNVPLTITRYKISHTVQNEVHNQLNAENAFENRPAYEITLEDGKSEQEIIRSLSSQGIKAFEWDFTRTPLGKRLLD
ncbi:hypothetical protein QFZ48_000144 [Chitinophaga sp. W2I13]|uniref:AlbA family DNA-binding domain-containing protein n=1 Tax=Chitinophaga sp. W2I13 TaxID=3373923 RepID=UPI003D1DE270